MIARARASLTAVLTALPLVAAIAAAPALADNADFVEGMRLYNDFEFEKASFRFRVAARSVILPPGEVAQANLWLGLALGQAGDDISARAAFVDALRLDEGLALPEDAPPTLRPIFSDARAAAFAAAASPAPGELHPPPPAAEPGPPTLSPITIAGLSLIGAGVLVIAGGIGTGVYAVAQADAARQQHFQEDANAAEAAADGTAQLANLLFVVGGATVASGVTAVVAAPFVE